MTLIALCDQYKATMFPDHIGVPIVVLIVSVAICLLVQLGGFDNR